MNKHIEVFSMQEKRHLSPSQLKPNTVFKKSEKLTIVVLLPQISFCFEHLVASIDWKFDCENRLRADSQKDKFKWKIFIPSQSFSGFFSDGKELRRMKHHTKNIFLILQKICVKHLNA